MTVEFGFRSKKFDFFRYFFPGNMRNISVSVFLTKIIGIQSNVFRYSIVFFFCYVTKYLDTWQIVFFDNQYNENKAYFFSLYYTYYTHYTYYTYFCGFFCNTNIPNRRISRDVLFWSLCATAQFFGGKK